MAFLESGGQPRDERAFLQARQGMAAVVLCFLTLTACADRATSGPEAWWHDAIGGKIAERRPPPPGDQDAFPNLAAVPARPARPDPAAMSQMTAGLISDRIAANHAAALAPIPDPAARVTSSPPPPRAEGASASLAAMTRPPSPPVVNTPAGQGAMAPSPASASPVPSPQARIPSTGAAVSSPSVQAAGAAAPPPVARPAAPAAPAQVSPAQVSPVQGVAPAGARPVSGLVIEFTLRSAALNDAALDQLKAFAATRGERGVAITGRGEAAGSDPLAQSDALTLALARAQSVSTALAALGVPGSAMRLDAQAAGRGARLRLLQ